MQQHWLTTLATTTTPAAAMAAVMQQVVAGALLGIRGQVGGPCMSYM
jgi:hypothetical protein